MGKYVVGDAPNAALVTDDARYGQICTRAPLVSHPASAETDYRGRLSINGHSVAYKHAVEKFGHKRLYRQYMIENGPHVDAHADGAVGFGFDGIPGNEAMGGELPPLRAYAQKSFSDLIDWVEKAIRPPTGKPCRRIRRMTSATRVCFHGRNASRSAFLPYQHAILSAFSNGDFNNGRQTSLRRIGTKDYGYIDVKNDKNGTLFEMYFSITRDEISLESGPLAIQAYKGNGESILVVDDIENQREIMRQVPDSIGYNTKAVSSGEEAVEYLE